MQLGIGLEAKAPIISWVTKDDAATRASGSKLIEASFDERGSNSLPFAAWHYCYRTKAEPAFSPSIDRDRRKCHVAHDPVAIRRNKGNGQASRRAKGLYDPSFVSAAMLGPAKGSGNDFGNGFLVPRNFGPYRHRMCMPFRPRVGNGWKSCRWRAVMQGRSG